MFRPRYQNVYLADPLPSAAALMPAIRRCLIEMVSWVELAVNNDSEEKSLPLAFGSKRRKRRRKSTSSSLLVFEHVLVYADQISMSECPCVVRGLGPASTPQRPSLIVQLIQPNDHRPLVEVQDSSLLRQASAEVILQTLYESWCHRSLSTAVEDENLAKYWDQRYRLFSRFDQGIRLDREGWFSVTPEAIARHISSTCRAFATRNGFPLDIVLDAFSGCGGNAIAMAAEAPLVIAVELRVDSSHHLMHNARVYGRQNRIEVIANDLYEFIKSDFRQRNVDLVLLAPPWGGIDYSSDDFDMRQSISSGDGIQLAELIASNVCDNIVYLLPRNLKYAQIEELQASLGGACIVESIHLHGKLKMIALYLGPMFFSKKEKLRCTDIFESSSFPS